MPWIVVWCQVVGGVSEGVVWDWGWLGDLLGEARGLILSRQ